MEKFILTVLVLCLSPVRASEKEWGFFAHKQINRIAVYTLPIEMVGFYKEHIVFIEEQATTPDARRYIMPQEAPRHYIDLDVYGDSALETLPKYWQDAVTKYGEDTLNAYGIVPWHINFVKYQLTEAFKERNARKILKLSADLGHYVGDAHVPLHTTENYNGQLTGQVGIHGFWESRLPEIFFETYDLFTGKASYLPDPQSTAWEIIRQSHAALDSVLEFERILSSEFDASRKHGYELRNNKTVRVYSHDFSEAYHQKLSGMVERRMRSAIFMTGSFWYTSWVDAGQPILEGLSTEPEEADTVKELNFINRLRFRNHESAETEWETSG